ncbi:M48 family metallopeptidase [Microlunatus capsulatus]|uniref:Zn-dependent protease with chaperone function n=1 Tax=Microlunatus capsulatus TaxID=99117 RepID=A0ABS4Z4P7_9ACTN|nr:M48 family metallopeptidase [Microlunatus capsulatus]MBP2415770.1 Zn-dependent protease with chaperone function [Microlunatus capsulatus]
MSYADSRALRPGRIRFAGISPRAYEHPADRGALVALRAIPGFDAVLKAVLGAVGERSERLLYLATAVRVSARQYPELHVMVTECATALDLPRVPELYVTQDPHPDAFTVGTDRPVIVTTTGMLQLLDADGMRFVIGHEVGHVLSGHGLYRMVLTQLVAISASVQWLPLGAWGLRAIVLALHEWYRKAELSADRAGLLCTQDPAAALKVHAALAGALHPDDMDVAGFLDQAREYQSSGDVRDSVLKLLQISGQTHPMAALRAAELQQWAATGDYREILAGDYLRREDDARTPISDDVRAAAASYQQMFSSSSDPLVGLVGKIGSAVGSVGGFAAHRVRDWWQGQRPPS